MHVIRARGPSKPQLAVVGTAHQPGGNSIQARGTDLAARTQPGQPPWNRHGYGNNAIQTVLVQVTP
jgi:hypothetical protein